MKEQIQGHFYGEWNDEQKAKREAAQRRAYKKAGVSREKAKRGKRWDP